MWRILLVIALLVSFLNYTPGTYLSGWDTLHPEFNFAEYFKRVIFGVWQAHQGLGALATQAHASELPRLLLLYPLSFVLPDNFLRYFYIFSSLVLGPLGVYYFIKSVLKLKDAFAFLGGLFYLLNLVTVQHFYVPLEMFATHYALVPWLFSFVIKFLETRKRKFIILFGLTSFLSASMAHTATLWYAYFASLTIFLVIYNFLNQKKLTGPSLKIILITLLTNAFWLLPNLYFILNRAQVVSGSKIHTLFTEEAFAQNASFGTLQNFALFKNFLFNWGEYVGDNKFAPLLNEWIKHLENPVVLFIGYSFFLIIILGIISSIKAKNKAGIAIFSIFILSTFFLLNVNPPFGFIFELMQKVIPNFSEAIRFPFTKFSLLFIFSASIFFALGIDFLNRRLPNIKNIQVVLLLLVSFSIFYYMLPAFRGGLVSSSMRVNIPKEYFSLFKYFKDKPYGRIAPFPIHSFWGWTYNEWGGRAEGDGARLRSDSGDKGGRSTNNIYQGAGFMWFGLEQPILDREFDRWEPNNEQYYREMSHAVYTQNPDLFKYVLSKYNISYILIDKSVVSAGLDEKVLFANELQKLINSQTNIVKDAQFGDYLLVYKVSQDDRTSNSIFVVKNSPQISPKFSASFEDFAFQKYGNYETYQQSGSFYPFRNIIDNQNRLLGGNITQEGALLKLPEITGNRELIYPSFQALENFFAVDLNMERTATGLKVTFFPKFPKSSLTIEAQATLPQSERNFLLSINQKDNFILNDPPINTPLSLGNILLNTKGENSIAVYRDSDDSKTSPDFSSIPYLLEPCEGGSKSPSFGVTPKTNGFSLFGKNTYVCMTVPLSSIFNALPQARETLLGVSFDSENPSVCIADLNNRNCKQYELRNLLLRPLTQTRSSLYFGIKREEFANLGVKFFLDASAGDAKASFDNVIFTLKNPAFNATFSDRVLNQALDSAQTIKAEDINIPFSGDAKLSEDITRLPKTSGDCPINPGVVSPPTKKLIKEQIGSSFIRYSSSDGSFCDHFSYQNLSQDQGYVIVIRSRNVKGLPIRLCVTNQTTKRCDVYAHLSRSKEFTNDVFLLPPMKSGGDGYDINVNNFAVKNIPSINDIASINIIPFPYNWLSQIETVSNSQISTRYYLLKNEVKRLNNSLYVADLSNAQKGDLLVLSESYEPGWKAFKIPDTKLLNLVFPFLRGEELKEHSLVNNWANGWKIQEDNNEILFAIVFLPQYLEYFGFLILLGTGIYPLSKRFVKRN